MYGKSRNSLAGLKLGSPQVHLNLALFPLLDEVDRAPDYLLLDEALERRVAHVTEVSGEGRVPELAFENASSEKILLVDGDELVGAKQNRILNLTILVGVGQKIVVPVSCVEQGRWSYRSRDFRSAGRVLFGKARAKKVQRVSESLRSSGDRRANQSEIWADVAEKAAYLQVDSSTMSMGDIYEGRGSQLNAYVKAFQAERESAWRSGRDRREAGRGGTVRLLDRLRALPRKAPAQLCARCDRDRGWGATGSLPEDEVRRFLDSIQAAAAERFTALGEGEDIRLTGDGHRRRRARQPGPGCTPGGFRSCVRGAL